MDLEQKNFKAAGEILAYVWSESVIDSHPVFAEFCPSGCESEFGDTNQIWIDRNVRRSKYLLQIVKCNSRSCCSPSRIYYQSIIESRFLPPPIHLKITKKSPAVHQDGNYSNISGSVGVWRRQFSTPTVQPWTQSSTARKCFWIFWDIF